MSKFLSLNWFKSKIETAVERVIANKIDELMQQEDGGSDCDIDVKPFTKAKIVDDTLIVVLRSGEIVSKPDATLEDFRRVQAAKSEEEIINIISTEEVRQERMERQREIERIQALKKGLSVLEGLNDFDVVENSVYIKGINRSLPQLLVEKFIEVVEREKYYTGFGDLEANLAENHEYQGLKRFFMWCCLNPRAEVADSLYDFLMRNSFRITKQGFFAALRNVVTLHGSNELVQFVSNAYNKVKAVWKKSPDKYTVFLQDGNYKLVHEEDLFKEETLTSTTCPDCLGHGGWYDEDSEGFEEDWVECDDCDGSGEVGEYEHTQIWPINHGEKIGGLTELYLDLPNRHENRFTDDWTKTFDIRIGQVVNMPIDKCNWSTQDCAAAGLHFTSDQIHYVGCGDQSVLVLINPMKVVGIGQHKGRCYEYLPIMTVPREEATELLHDMNFDVLQLDESFAVRELQNLAEKAKDGFVAESKKYDFNIPSISATEINNIVTSLEEMKNEISKRIVTIS